jgi:protein-ribulosamine 3-kinase
MITGYSIMMKSGTDDITLRSQTLPTESESDPYVQHMQRSSLSIPQILLENLQALEPNSEFMGYPPRIQSSSGKTYFAKTGSSLEKEQYIGEVESLKAIESAAPSLAPNVLSFGVGNEDRPYFISEYKDLGPITDESGKILAKRLATELHAHQSAQGFGFHVPTYCGATRLKNGWFTSWEKCFSVMIGDLLNELANQRCYGELCSKGEEIRRQ